MVAKHPLSGSPDIEVRLAAARSRGRAAERLRAARRRVKEAQTLILRDELKARRRVLRRLGYLSDDDVVQLKGRVAAEIATCDELARARAQRASNLESIISNLTNLPHSLQVATELMMTGAFAPLSPEAVVALVSCLVWREKVADAKKGKLRDELDAAYGTLREAGFAANPSSHGGPAAWRASAPRRGGGCCGRQVARRVAKVAAECKMLVDVEEFVDGFSSDLMETSFAWAKGAKFGEVLKLSGVFEGSLIRAARNPGARCPARSCAFAPPPPIPTTRGMAFALSAGAPLGGGAAAAAGRRRQRGRGGAGGQVQGGGGERQARCRLRSLALPLMSIRGALLVLPR